MSEGRVIPEVPFRPPGGRPLGFEALEMAEVRRRIGRAALCQVHRVEFHTITLIRSGVGPHTVDFVSYPCRPGTVLWVRPGQVQQFHEPASLDGVHLLFVDAFPPPSMQPLLDRWLRPTVWQPAGRTEPAGLAEITTLVDQLRHEFSRPPGETSVAILQHLLAALMLQLRRSAPPATDAHAETGIYERFRRELERQYTRSRRVEDYAARLGYTAKTLTRACLKAMGHSAKQVIDDRVALEAQRMLAHTDAPVASIARQLGFAEPTNFGKFFARQTGTTPGAFRDSHRVAIMAR